VGEAKATVCKGPGVLTSVFAFVVARTRWGL